MATKTKESGDMCPKCGIKMKNTGTSLNCNSLYENFKCESCGHSAMRCSGMLPEKERY